MTKNKMKPTIKRMGRKSRWPRKTRKRPDSMRRAEETTLRMKAASGLSLRKSKS